MGSRVKKLQKLHPQESIAESIRSAGICVKTKDQVVQYQNNICERICGKLEGQKCEKNCMEKYSRTKFNESFELGMRLFKNIEADGSLVDATIINDGQTITTILFETGKRLELQMSYLESFGLTKTETKIVNEVLKGYSNQEIADRLFISKSTLRTHLNNFYKKIPEDIRREIEKAMQQQKTA